MNILDEYVYINPMNYVIETINENINNIFISKDIIRLIKACLEFYPDRPKDVLERIERKFPQFKEDIGKYKLLL